MWFTNYRHQTAAGNWHVNKYMCTITDVNFDGKFGICGFFVHTKLSKYRGAESGGGGGEGRVKVLASFPDLFQFKIHYKLSGGSNRGTRGPPLHHPPIFCDIYVTTYIFS